MNPGERQKGPPPSRDHALHEMDEEVSDLEQEQETTRSSGEVAILEGVQLPEGIPPMPEQEEQVFGEKIGGDLKAGITYLKRSTDERGNPNWMRVWVNPETGGRYGVDERGRFFNTDVRGGVDWESTRKDVQVLMEAGWREIYDRVGAGEQPKVVELETEERLSEEDLRVALHGSDEEVRERFHYKKRRDPEREAAGLRKGREIEAKKARRRLNRVKYEMPIVLLELERKRINKPLFRKRSELKKRGADMSPAEREQIEREIRELEEQKNQVERSIQGLKDDILERQGGDTYLARTSELTVYTRGQNLDERRSSLAVQELELIKIISRNEFIPEDLDRLHEIRRETLTWPTAREVRVEEEIAKIQQEIEAGGDRAKLEQKIADLQTEAEEIKQSREDRLAKLEVPPPSE